MQYEDTTLLFNFYYGSHQPLSSVWHVTNGYVSLIPNFMAWIFAHFPTYWMPFLFAGFPLVLWTITFTVVCGTNLWRNRLDAMVFTSVMGLSCVSQSIFYHNTMSSQWTLLWLLLVLVISRFGENLSVRQLLWRFLVVAVLVPSHPYSILAVPPLILNIILVKTKRVRVQNLFIIALIISYFLTLDHSKSSMENILHLKVLKDICIFFFRDIALFSFFRFNITEIPPLSLSKTVFILVASLAYVTFVTTFIWVHHRAGKKLGFDLRDLVALYLIVGCSLIYFCSYRYEQYWSNPPPRYYVVQQFLWLTILLRMLGRILEVSKANIESQVRVYLLCTLFIAGTHVSQFGQDASSAGVSISPSMSEITRLEKEARKRPGIPLHYQKPGWNGGINVTIIYPASS